MFRRVFVLVSALLVAVQIVRNAAVDAFADRSPDLADRVWSGHPAAEASLAMTSIGRAAGRRRPLPASAFTMIDDVARKAPLAPEPFLVRGVEAQLAGDVPLAIQAFGAAEQRDPRALPAHFFLADLLFRSGNASRGLKEIAVLARLSPLGIGTISPYVATYARDRSTWPQLRALFRDNPDLEETTLTVLARDPANAGAVLALSNPQLRKPTLGWVSGLIYGLIGSGEYAKAHAVWAGISRVRSRTIEQPYDSLFRDSASPAPFNWELTSSGVGLAERQRGGRLHVIFYGREDGVLARQLLLLAPGRYRLTMAVTGGPEQARALTWSLRCDRSQAPFAAVAADIAASRPLPFTVPATCPAQWIELTGVSSDVARQSELVISRLGIDPDSSHG